MHQQTADENVRTAKAERRWFQKKRFTAPPVAFGLVALLGLAAGPVEETDQTASPMEAEVPPSTTEAPVATTQTTETTEPSAEKDNVPATTVEPAESAGPAVPSEVAFSMIDSVELNEEIPGIKKSLTIRLHDRITEEELTALGERYGDPSYERTFISYFLPDMDHGDVYWASTHWNPDMDVKINGITVEGMKLFIETPLDPDWNVLGVWGLNSFGGNSRLVIYQESGQLFLHSLYQDGSNGTELLVELESSVPGERWFEESPSRGHGEFMALTGDGRLEDRDDDGAFRVSQQIEMP